MNQLTIFRILTFILLPFAGLFAFIDLLMLLVALRNPALLLGIFILASFVIYVFSSLKFLTKGIDINQPCKPKLRDWIRVNAFVCLFMCASILINTVGILASSDAALHEQAATVRDSFVNAPSILNAELFVKTMKISSWFLGILAVLLLIHILINFKLMKKYRGLFVAENQP